MKWRIECNCCWNLSKNEKKTVANIGCQRKFKIDVTISTKKMLYPCKNPKWTEFLLKWRRNWFMDSSSCETWQSYSDGSTTIPIFSRIFLKQIYPIIRPLLTMSAISSPFIWTFHKHTTLSQHTRHKYIHLPLTRLYFTFIFHSDATRHSAIFLLNCI